MTTSTPIGGTMPPDGRSFRRQVPTFVGSNTFSVTATETEVAPGANAQSTSRTWQLTLAAGTGRTHSYDANGNLTSIQENGSVTRSFEWDAEDRLVAINYPGSGNRTEFSYDPMSRRVRAKELGSVISDERLVWDGLAIAEIHSTATGTVTNRFLGMGEQRGALTLYYFRDHLGSVREMTDAAGTLLARLD